MGVIHPDTRSLDYNSSLPAWNCQKHHQNVEQRQQAPVGRIEAERAGCGDYWPTHRRERIPNQDAQDVEEQVASIRV